MTSRHQILGSILLSCQTRIVCCTGLPRLCRLVLGLLILPVLEVLVDSGSISGTAFAHHRADAALGFAGLSVQGMIEGILLDLISRDELFACF